jgi:geranylgeranyl pyrophosphate synthase
MKPVASPLPPSLAAWIATFEAALSTHVKTHMEPHSTLTLATLYAIETPGKRVRPTLVHESSSLVQLPSRPSQLLQFAVELIHSFSLVHDDLPALDNDDFRRGKPTVHKQFGEAQAVLVGDVLFQLGVQSLLQAAPQVESMFFARGAQFFIEAMGSQGLIGGQSSEIEFGSCMTPAQLERVQDQKTGALFRACILTPFYWMGVGEADPLFQEAQEFAHALGFAFQIADDLADAEQDRAREVESNLRSNPNAISAPHSSTKNILSLYGVDQARKIAIDRLTSCRLHSHFSVTEMLIRQLQA